MACGVFMWWFCVVVSCCSCGSVWRFCRLGYFLARDGFELWFCNVVVLCCGLAWGFCGLRQILACGGFVLWFRVVVVV